LRPELPTPGPPEPSTPDPEAIAPRFWELRLSGLRGVRSTVAWPEQTGAAEWRQPWTLAGVCSPRSPTPETAMSPSPARSPRARKSPARPDTTAPARRTRVEHDSMGELQVPADALWGAQTQRAVQNFPVSGRPMPRGFIRALGLVKAAAAEVNAGLGLLAKSRSIATRAA